MARIVTTTYSLDIVYAPFEQMSDEEFFHFCSQNKHIPIERDENHQILFMAPVTPDFFSKNSDLTTELTIWNRIVKSGRVFDSSAGFYLPDGSMRSPDAAWVSHERWNAMPPRENIGFAYVAPDFVAELLSPTDSLTAAKEKMEKWRHNGVQLGWLIDVANETVHVYRSNGTDSAVTGFNNKLSGEDVLPGFELDLTLLHSKFDAFGKGPNTFQATSATSNADFCLIYSQRHQGHRSDIRHYQFT
jgi:Uma2 family endonuclease